jgi:hypothetical protein
MEDRRFTAPVDEIEGTIDSVSAGGVTLEEYPGRKFQFSSVGMSAADMSARILDEHNDQTRGKRPFSLFAAIGNNYRPCRIYLTIIIYMNYLRSTSHGCTRWTSRHQLDRFHGI